MERKIIGRTISTPLNPSKINSLVNVPDWAMQPNKPSYTASEIGAAEAHRVVREYEFGEYILALTYHTAGSDVQTDCGKLLMYLSTDGVKFIKIAALDVGVNHKIYDPSVIYYDNKWIIAYDYIDMSFNNWTKENSDYHRGGNRVGILTTTDFTTFTQKSVDLPMDWKSTWAPELFIDNGKLQMVLTTSSCTSTFVNDAGLTRYVRDGIYICQLDNDFNVTSSTEIVLPKEDNLPANFIDASIFHENWQYYLTIVNANKSHQQIYCSNNLCDGYTLIKEFSEVCEGMDITKFKNKYFAYADKFHYYDNYEGHGTYISVSDDLHNWSGMAFADIQGGAHNRHFTPFVVSTDAQRTSISSFLASRGNIDALLELPTSKSYCLADIGESVVINKLLLEPNATYYVSGNGNAIIHDVDTSLLSHGNKCAFVIASANDAANITFKRSAYDKIRWNNSGDFVFNIKNSVIYLHCTCGNRDRYCFFMNPAEAVNENIVDVLSIVLYNDNGDVGSVDEQCHTDITSDTLLQCKDGRMDAVCVLNDENGAELRLPLEGIIIGMHFSYYSFSRVYTKDSDTKTKRYSVLLRYSSTDLGEPAHVSIQINDAIDIKDFPVATSEHLGTVKPETKTAEMTQPVGIDTDGRLWTALTTAIPGGLFTVNYTDNEDEYKRIDKSFDEIKTAIDSGMVVQCKYGNEIIPLVEYDDNLLEFNHTGLSDDLIIHIYASGTAYVYQTYLYNPSTGQNVGPTVFFRVESDGDCGWLVTEGTNDQVCYGFDMKCILVADDYLSEFYLPFVHFDNESGVYTFSEVFPSNKAEDTAKRYTVKMNSNGLGEDPPNIVEVFVEEIDNYSLPVAATDTLGGVKPVAKTEDMTQPVGVDEKGRLWTVPSAGGSNEWRLAKEVTLEETVKAITISEDDDGNPLNASEIFYEWHNPSGTDSKSMMYITIYNADGSACKRVTCGDVNQSGNEVFTTVRMSRLGNAVYVSSVTSKMAHQAGTCSAVPVAVENDRITKINIATDGRMYMYAGATLKLYIRG